MVPGLRLDAALRRLPRPAARPALMSGPFTEDPTPLSTRLVDYYREMLRTHADDPAVGACLVCRRSRCADYRFAWERLVCAGELAP